MTASLGYFAYWTPIRINDIVLQNTIIDWCVAHQSDGYFCIHYVPNDVHKTVWFEHEADAIVFALMGF